MNPGYSNYPRMNPGVYGARPPGAHFDFIGEAFNIVRADFATWGVVSLLSIVISYAISFSLGMVSNLLAFGSVIGTGRNSGFGALLVSLPFTIFFGAISYSVSYLLYIGLGMMGLRASRGETVQVGDLFRPFSRIVPVFVVSLIVSFAIYLGILLLIIPGMIATGLLGLAGFAAYDQGLSPGEAIKWSVERSKPHLWALFGLFFVAGLVSGLGVFLCCVGLLFTFPILGIVMGLTYGTFVPAPAMADGMGYPGGVDPNSNYPRGAYPPAPQAPPAPGEAPSPPQSGGMTDAPPRSTPYGEVHPHQPEGSEGNLPGEPDENERPQ